MMPRSNTKQADCLLVANSPVAIVSVIPEVKPKNIYPPITMMFA